MKKIKQLLLITIGLSLSISSVMADCTESTSGNSVTITCSESGTISVSCSDYPGKDNIYLNVNGHGDNILCDITPPTGTVNFTLSTSNSNGFVGPSGQVKVTVASCNDQTPGSGCNYAKNNTQSGIFYSNTTSTINIYDNVGNTGTIAFDVNQFDTTPPTGTVTYSGYISSYTWISKDNLVINVGCSDDQSGCEEDSYTKSGTTITLDPDNRTGSINIRDNVGNTNSVAYDVKDKIDFEPPTFVHTSNIPNSKKAGTGNVNVFGEVYDDGNLNGDNYPVNYNITIKGPYTSIGGLNYTGALSISSGSVDILSTGSVQNNGTLDKTFTLTGAGLYQFTLKLTDKSGQEYSTGKIITIYPSDLAGSPKSQVEIVDIAASKFANNSDYYEYKLTLKDEFGNYIWGKSIADIKQTCNGYSITSPECKEIKLNEVDSTGENATTITTPIIATNSSGSLNFKLSSYTPGSFTSHFYVEINRWGDDYNQINPTSSITTAIGNASNYTFSKPISITLEVSNDGVNWNSTGAEIGKEQLYRVKLVDNTSGSLSISNGELRNINSGSIIQGVEGHFWLTFSGASTKAFNNINALLLFTGSIDGTGKLLSGTHIIAKELPIYYRLSSEDVAYKLDNAEIKGCDKGTLGVKVEGTLQSDGKASSTGQEENFSDLSTAEMRGIIKKNATQLTRGMTSDKDKVINGVKYFEGDISISGIQNYETLIVKNGNVYISSNVSSNSGKPLGIIVLKDNYDVKNDWNNAGNVYVANDVTNINAVIYADGALRSANFSGERYNDLYLLSKLELVGSLFSRNTIGGATSIGGDYLLPGGQKTPDFDLAQIYDLNFVRKTPICGSDDYAFLIRYDSRIQTNPPKGFSR